MTDPEAVAVLTRPELAALVREAVAEAMRRPPEYLTRAELCAELSVNRDTLRAWVAKGLPVANLPSAKGSKPIKRYPRRRVLAWVEKTGRRRGGEA